MRKIYCITLIIISFTCCKKSPDKLIAGRWDFIGASPVTADSSEITSQYNPSSNEQVTYTDFSEKSFAGNKLILRNDGIFDLSLFQAYLHGKWNFTAKQKLLKLFNETQKDSFVLRIDSISSNYIELNCDSNFINRIQGLSHRDTSGMPVITSCTFYLYKNRDRYANQENDPYSIVYNKWRIKPQQQENQQQIKERVLNHLEFLRMIFKDADDKNRTTVSYNFFNTPLIIASNGIALKYFEDIQEDWSKNFFDSAQAHTGYRELRKSFSKKINHLQTDNLFEKKTDMFRQMIENVKAN